MSSKEKINNQYTRNISTHMDTSILGGNPMSEKTITIFVSLFFFYYKEKIITSCTSVEYYHHIGYYLEEVTTSTYSLTLNGRDLQPPNPVY